jgi:hypothetical protein
MEMLSRLLVSILIQLSLVACSALLPRGPSTATVQEGGIEYRLETARSSYGAGEVVALMYSITNTTQENFQPGMVPNCEYCAYQLHATRDNREVWRTCRVIPPCGWAEFSLAPGETREWTEEWALTNDNGTLEPEDDFPLDPGIYTIVAELYLSTTAGRMPVSIQLQIK